MDEIDLHEELSVRFDLYSMYYYESPLLLQAKTAGDKVGHPVASANRLLMSRQ